jgi:hypothetical protein
MPCRNYSTEMNRPAMPLAGHRQTNSSHRNACIIESMWQTQHSSARSLPNPSWIPQTHQFDTLHTETVQPLHSYSLGLTNSPQTLRTSLKQHFPSSPRAPDNPVAFHVPKHEQQDYTYRSWQKIIHKIFHNILHIMIYDLQTRANSQKWLLDLIGKSAHVCALHNKDRHPIPPSSSALRRGSLVGNPLIR